MEETLHALGGLLLEAIPTILFFLFLNLFLKQVFFKPVGNILEERKKETEGVRELSKQAFETADRKSAEFEKALQLARQQINAENEELRKHWAAEEAKVIDRARADAERRRSEARAEVADELTKAHEEMEGQIDILSQSIVDRLLGRRAA